MVQSLTLPTRPHLASAAMPGHSTRLGTAAWPWQLAFVLAALSFLAYGLARPYQLDDSVFLIFSEDWIHGTPYALYDNKLPGTFLLHGSAMQLFGHHVWTGRIVSWVLMLGTALLCVPAVGQALSRAEQAALALLALVALWMAEGSLVMTEAGLATCAALGFYALRDGLFNARAAFFAGLIFAAGAWFKQVGYGVPLAYGTVALFQVLTRQAPWRTTLFALLAHLSGFALVTTALWGLAAQAGLAEVLWQRCFADMASYPRRYSLGGGLLLALRLGWFVLPALLLLALHLWPRRGWQTDARVLMAGAVALGFLLPLIQRPYAHYALAAVPALLVLLAHGWVTLGRTWAPRLVHPRALGLLGLLALGMVAGGVVLKHESLGRIFGWSGRPDVAGHAQALGAYLADPTDQALFVDRGPDDLKAASLYYYTGARPPLPYLFFHNLPSEATAPWIERLPALLADPAVHVVTFNPELGYHPYWRPIPEATRAEVEAVLRAHYTLRPDLGATWVWIRNEAQPDPAGPARGPFAH